MQEVTTSTLEFPSTSSRDALTEVVHRGAQRMLAEAIEAEVAEWIESHRDVTDAEGRRQVVRNGRMPERTIVTGAGRLAPSALSQAPSLGLRDRASRPPLR
jgi:hypothetical protein